jgi:hypothetical protein
MRFAACLVLVACGQTPPPIKNRSPPPVPNALPCGASTLAELDPGKPRTSSCTLGEHGLYEGGKLIMKSETHGALIAFDPRVPGPQGIRVGHTGRDVERLAPAYVDIKCSEQDAMTMCLLESPRDQELACDNAGVGGITLYFEFVREARVPCCNYALVGARAREVLRDRKVVAVQVRGPECT